MLFFSFLGKSQVLKNNTNLVLTHNFNYIHRPKFNIIEYKANKFKFTLKTTIDRNSYLNGDKINLFQHDFRTKYYISKRVSLLFRTQINPTSQIIYLGIAYKFKK
jgi:hypothetical protein